MIELAAGRQKRGERGGAEDKRGERGGEDKRGERGRGQNTVSLNSCQNGKQHAASDDDDDDCEEKALTPTPTRLLSFQITARTLLGKFYFSLG